MGGGAVEVGQRDDAHEHAAVEDGEPVDAQTAAGERGRVDAVVESGRVEPRPQRVAGDGHRRVRRRRPRPLRSARTSSMGRSLTTALAAAKWPPPPTAASASATSSRPPRLRAVTKTRCSISTSRKKASQPVRSMNRWATTLTPST